MLRGSLPFEAQLDRPAPRAVWKVVRRDGNWLPLATAILKGPFKQLPRSLQGVLRGPYRWCRLVPIGELSCRGRFIKP